MTEPHSNPGQPWYRRRWFFAAVAVAIGVLIITAIVYAVWLVSPQKALSDAIHHASVTPGTYAVTTGNGKISVINDGKLLGASGSHNGARFEAVVKGDTLYIKSQSPKVLYDEFLKSDSVPNYLMPVVNDLLNDVKDQWVSMDLEAIAAPAMQTDSSCGFAMNNVLSTDANAQRDVALAYGAHGFVDIKQVESKSSETTYDTSINGGTLKAFLDRLTSADWYRPIATNCAGFVSKLPTGDIAASSARVTVTQPEHHLRSVDVTSKSLGELSVTADYSRPPEKLSVPKDSVSYKDLAAQAVQPLFKSFFGAQ